jgi:hypothetical protein
MQDVTDLPEADLHDPNCLPKILNGLQCHGISLIHGAADRDRLMMVARRFLTVRRHRDSGPDAITIIARRRALPVGPSTAGFTDRELQPHTEGSSMAKPPHLLMISCLQPADSGGHIQLVDGRSLYQAVAQQDRAMLDGLRTPRSAYFGGAAGHLGAVFDRTDTGGLTIRLRLDDQVEFAPYLRQHLSTLQSLVREHTIEVVTRRGTGYVLLNDRWLHGRTSFTGHRQMLRLIGDRPADSPLLPGFRDPMMATSATA